MVRNRENFRNPWPSGRIDSERERDTNLDDTTMYSIFSPPAASKQQQETSTDTPWYSIFSSTETDAFKRTTDVPKRNRRQIDRRDRAPCVDARCGKKDFIRAPHLQAVMDRIERRRQLDLDAGKRRQKSAERRVDNSNKKTAKEMEQELGEVLDALSRYDSILEHRVKKNSGLKGFSDGRADRFPFHDINCSTEQVLDEQYEVRKFSSEQSSGQLRHTNKKEKDLLTPSMPKTSSTFSMPERFQKSEDSRRANIRYRKERLRRRKENGLHPNDVASSNRERTQHNQENGMPTAESRQTRETQDGRSSFPVDLTGYSAQSPQEQDDNSSGHSKQARQLKAHVDDVYQHSRELRDAQEMMRDEMQQIKNRFRDRQNQRNRNCSRNMEAARHSEEYAHKVACPWNLNHMKQFEDDTPTSKQGIADYHVENGVIILDDFDDYAEPSVQEEPPEFHYSSTPPPREDPPPSKDPGGFHHSRQDVLDDGSDESPEVALRQAYAEKPIGNIHRYLEEQYEEDRNEEEEFDGEGRKSEVMLPPALQRTRRRRLGDNDSFSSASQSVGNGSLEQFSRRRSNFWGDCGAAV